MYNAINTLLNISQAVRLINKVILNFYSLFANKYVLTALRNLSRV